MYLKILVFFVFNLFYLNYSFSQTKKTASDREFAKFIIKHYRADDAIWRVCNKNYAIIYFDIDETNRVKNVYGEDELGKLIAKDLGFSLNYVIKGLKTDKKTIAIFITLKNTSVNCVDTLNVYNAISFQFEGLLNKIAIQENVVYFIWRPIDLLTPDPIK